MSASLLPQMFLGTVSPLPGPLPDMSAVSLYKAVPSVEVDITPIPYNAQIDGAPPSGVLPLLATQAAWERMRGTQAYKDWKQKQLVALELVPGSSPSPGDSELPASSPIPSSASTDGTATGLLGVNAEGATVARDAAPQVASTAGRKLKSFVLA